MSTINTNTVPQNDATVGTVGLGVFPVSSPKEVEVYSVLAEAKGAKIISFVARTDARLKKTGNPYKGVVKVAKINALVSFLYDEGVLRRLAKEGKSPEDFRKGTSWHTPILNPDGGITPFCRHPESGKVYLRVCCLKKVSETFEDADGVELTREQVAPFLPKSNEYQNQGLDAPLVFLTYALENIQEITVDGRTWTLAV